MTMELLRLREKIVESGKLRVILTLLWIVAITVKCAKRYKMLLGSMHFECLEDRGYKMNDFWMCVWVTVSFANAGLMVLVAIQHFK